MFVFLTKKFIAITIIFSTISSPLFGGESRYTVNDTLSYLVKNVDPKKGDFIEVNFDDDTSEMRVLAKVKSIVLPFKYKLEDFSTPIINTYVVSANKNLSMTLAFKIRDDAFSKIISALEKEIDTTKVLQYSQEIKAIIVLGSSKVEVRTFMPSNVKGKPDAYRFTLNKVEEEWTLINYKKFFWLGRGWYL